MGSQVQQAQSLPMATNTTTLLSAPFQSTGVRPLGAFGSLARQSSIYSLTLDEFQNSIPDVKNFGSMNMDEFLRNIWSAEDSQAVAALMSGHSGDGQGQASAPGDLLSRQPSGLQRQGSLTLPRTLSSKTVDEVWRDIHASNGGGANSAAAAQQQGSASFGGMTLEDFLVRAGAFREDLDAAAFNSSSAALGDSGADRGEMGGVEGGAGDRDLGGGGSGSAGGGAGAGASAGGGGGGGALSLSAANTQAQAALDAMQLDAYKQQQVQAQWLNDLRNAQQQQAHMMAAQHEAAAYVSAAKRMANGAPIPAGLGSLGVGLASSLAGSLGIGLGPGQALGALALAPASPTSPVSDGMNGCSGLSLSPVGGGGFGFDGLRGRKRVPEGPVEKVVERRQRRMIKNRESAARSRARKQAYTVELEAEVNLLKEENMRLRKLQEEEMKKKQIMEAMFAHAQQSAPESRTNSLRRSRSGPW